MDYVDVELPFYLFIWSFRLMITFLLDYA
jgi:hypothetical protein